VLLVINFRSTGMFGEQELFRRGGKK
jgi:hypothetical protein